MARRTKKLPVELQEELDAKKAKIKKPRKKRKPMTPEQKAAAAERLAKARAARAASKPSNRPEEFDKYEPSHPLSWESTKEALVELTELLKSLKDMKDSNKWQDRNQYTSVEAQITFLKQYMNTGVYSSVFYGKNMQSKIRYKCVSMAYYSDGTPKRSVGTFYQDLGCEYTQEMENDDREKVLKARANQQKKKKKITIISNENEESE